jgi:hypothetical protein
MKTKILIQICTLFEGLKSTELRKSNFFVDCGENVFVTFSPQFTIEKTSKGQNMALCTPLYNKLHYTVDIIQAFTECFLSVSQNTCFFVKKVRNIHLYSLS